METQAVRRRVNVIASHISAHEDMSTTAAATHLFPVSCSNSLNSVIRRCDSKMYFARQCSSSQACFMRQATNEQGRFMQSTTPLKATSCRNMDLYTSDVPMFSRPAGSNLQNVQEIQFLLRGCNYLQPMLEAPCFARPSRTCPQFQSDQRKQALEANGFEWSPRMDVAESQLDYLITVELPGVKVSGIKVEVSDQNLTVTGSRSVQQYKIASCSNNSVAAYHVREISRGLYKLVWPLPTNVKKDSISAEFVDGLLQITVPKISEERKPRKGYM